MTRAAGVRTLSRAIRPRQCLAVRRYATAPAAVEQLDNEPFLPEHVPTTPTTPPVADRRKAIRDAKPFSEFLTDTFHRQHDYLRISVTERCNLRCLYCMPEEGIQLSPNKDILTSAEIYYLSALFVNQGVTKIRLTGGEPTVRKDIVPLMQQIGSLRRNGLKEMALTTNAISLHRKLDALVDAGLTGVNISLDTLDPFQFQILTRRQGFDAVMKSINRVQEMNKMGANVKLKINAVVMRGLNDHQILPFVEKTREEDIEVRFIEYMPFGGNKWSQNKMLPYSEMLDMIRQKYPGFERLKDAKNDTSKTYQVPGFRGRVGFITSMTHNFCGTCNRLRITSDGNLKVCLHGDAEVSLRDILRSEHGGEPMDEAAFEAIRQLELDRRKDAQLRFDGEDGWMSKEQQLLDVIGAAVKRKKAKHAGMGELENMKNRPMILIDDHRNPTVMPNHTLRLQRAQQFQFMTRSSLRRGPPRSIRHDLSQVRYSSDNAADKAADSIHQSAHPEAEREDGESSNTLFGFQSLRSLLAPPEPPRRYSRPDDTSPRRRRVTLSASESKTVPSSQPRRTANKQDAVVKPFFTSRARPPAENTSSTAFGMSGIEPSSHESVTSDPPMRKSGRALEDEHMQIKPVSTPSADAPAEEAPRSKVLIRKGIARESYAYTMSGLPRARRARMMAAPMAPGRDTQRPRIVKHVSAMRPIPRARVNLVRKNRARHARLAVEKPALAASPVNSVTPAPESPWGLSQEEQELHTAAMAEGATGVDGRGSVIPRTSSEISTNVAQPQTPQLTHLKPSGEAHMVDVGAKAATKRTAIAYATVKFSNPESARLIAENGNKKGDVLGIARVAGIMATKRTADLIPLCHPVTISKVDVDVRLRTPATPGKGFGISVNGAVDVLVQVDCTGPTGVEMEALVGANCAAMTVYDMCKAVDKGMRTTSLVVYKAGGKSGLHFDPLFAHLQGSNFFVERSLEAPDLRPWHEAKQQEGSRRRAVGQSRAEMKMRRAAVAQTESELPST